MLGGSACSSKQENDPKADLATVELTVTGDVQGTFTGMADFDALETGQSQIWSLSMHDYRPQTFSLAFLRMNKGLKNPEVGTYTVGTGAGADFSAIFTHIVDENFSAAREFSSFGDGTSGTLTIESATDQMIKGSFDFSATGYDDQIQQLNTVHIKGKFKANKRQ